MVKVLKLNSISPKVNDVLDKNYEITIGNDKQNGVNSFNPDCGLIWSAYRPSDDVCHYKYFPKASSR